MRQLFILLLLIGQIYCYVEIGDFQQTIHGVSGKVYVIDTKTIMIKNFKYDGKGPAGLFWASESSNRTGVASNYFIVPDQKCGNSDTSKALPSYTGKTIVLTLPATKTTLTMNYFDVWCFQATTSFGHVVISDAHKAKIFQLTNDFDCVNRPMKQPVELGAFLQTSHGLKGKVSVVNQKTIKITGFSYDGLGPAGLFWGVKGDRAKIASEYFIIADENCKNDKIDDRLPKYTSKDITLTLPPSMTIYDMTHFDVWCEVAKVSFGYVQITEDAKKSLNILTEETICQSQNDSNSSQNLKISLSLMFLAIISILCIF